MSFYFQREKASENFLILLNAFTIFEYTFFCVFLYFALPRKLNRTILPIIWATFIILSLIDIVFINREATFDSIAIGIESIIIILFCIYYLFSQLRGTTSLAIYSTFDFWVVITFLIYFAGTFFLYLMTESMKGNAAFQYQYFIINISFNILKNLLLCVAMTMKSNISGPKTPAHPFPDLDDDAIFIHKKN